MQTAVATDVWVLACPKCGQPSRAYVSSINGGHEMRAPMAAVCPDCETPLLPKDEIRIRHKNPKKEEELISKIRLLQN